MIHVDNWASADPRCKGTVRFSPLPPEERNRGTGDFTEQEKDVWFAKLRAFVEGGGNLVLTDAALRGLSEITNIPGEAVEQATVYVGQVSFGKSSSEPTVEDPLATTPETIRQPAARFNDGMRRQTYESTPLGFAIQNQAGSDASFAPQFDIDRKAFEQAGGRVAGTSADAAPRTARPVYDRVALGEIKVGKGQIRVAGGLLPQPSQAFDHQLGIEPYALTYTGYILVRNLLSIPGIDAPPVSPPGPIVDRVAPQVRISSPTYSTERGRRGEFRVRWRGTDAGTGVFSYLLQVRELGPRGRARTRRTRVPAATPWRTLAAATRATSRVIRGRRGRTYQFRLRAVDGAGNISPFRAATTVVPLDDRDRGIRFRGRGWRTFLSRIAYMGRFRSSVRRGDTYRLVYRGESIALIGRRGPRGGKALVRFDRRRPRVIDFYAPNYLRRRVLIRFGAGPGRHVITVRVLGRKQRASRWTEVNLDGFGVARRG